jgi:hypothetical protein
MQIATYGREVVSRHETGMREAVATRAPMKYPEACCLPTVVAEAARC